MSTYGKRRPKKYVRPKINTAPENDEEFGKPTFIEPTLRRTDRSPILESGQVYMIGNGGVFHPAWCHIVADKWDSRSGRLRVASEDSVGTRRPCKSCDTPLTG